MNLGGGNSINTEAVQDLIDSSIANRVITDTPGLQIIYDDATPDPSGDFIRFDPNNKDRALPGDAFDENCLETIPWLVAQTTQTLTFGTMYGCYFRIPEDFDITDMSVISGAAAVGTTLGRLGLYAANPADFSLDTLLARSASDTALGSANTTVYKKALIEPAGSNPITINADRGDFVCATVLLAGTLGTAAQFRAFGSNAATTKFAADGRRKQMQRAGQADLPASVAPGDLAEGSNVIWFGLHGTPR